MALEKPNKWLFIEKEILILVAVAGLTVLCWALFLFFTYTDYVAYNPNLVTKPINRTNEPVEPKPVRKVEVVVLPHIEPKITRGFATVVAESQKTFAYVHGTAVVDGMLFIGMADIAGNSFSSNILTILDSANITKQATVIFSKKGDIQTMVYDSLNDKIYFLLSSNSSLSLFALDPHTNNVSTIISTTSIDVGRKPAIVTDGVYVYGITNTDPSKVFSVEIKTGKLNVSSIGHVANGHSAAIGTFGSTTELYFGGGMNNVFEKVDAVTLNSMGTVRIAPCDMTDDMPFQKVNENFGYVYIGCEVVPYGVRVKTSDLSYERFSLPGASLGMFIFGHDLYNAGRDGTINVFPRSDLVDLQIYTVNDGFAPLYSKGMGLEVNEILYSPERNKLFITGWWGVRGLFEVATSTTFVSLVK